MKKILAFCCVVSSLLWASCSKWGAGPCDGKVGCGGSLPIHGVVDVLLRDTVSIQTASALFDSLNHTICSVDGFSYRAIVAADSQSFVSGLYRAKTYLNGVAQIADTGNQMTFFVAFDTFAAPAQQDWLAFLAQYRLTDMNSAYKHLHIKVDSGMEVFYVKQFCQFPIVDTATQIFLTL
jgi:hypothetical protein